MTSKSHDIMMKSGVIPYLPAIYNGSPVAKEEVVGGDAPRLRAFALHRECGAHGHVQRVDVTDGAPRHDVAAHTGRVADLSAREAADAA